MHRSSQSNYIYISLIMFNGTITKNNCTYDIKQRHGFVKCHVK